LLKKTLSPTSAYLLVSHGSRDSRPQIALGRLAYLVQKFLAQETIPGQIAEVNDFLSAIEAQKTVATAIKSQLSWVETASLELASIPLHQSIQQFAQQIQHLGIKSIGIIPLFLSLGIHVREDLPQQVAIAKKQLRGNINLELLPYLGGYEQIWSLIAQQFRQMPVKSRIILAHGSAKAGANQAIEKNAEQLAAIAAYWATKPSLEEKVRQLRAEGSKKIGIVPYFLFTGRITDEIVMQVQELQRANPELELYLGQPLGATAELAQIISEEIKRNILLPED
jgi:sirohydrochlorin ferrochelatase